MIGNKNIQIIDLGKMDYQTAWDYQEAVLQQQVQRKREGLATENFLFFVEHNHVYTLGKSGNLANVLLTDKELEAREIQFFKTNRGGDITYHGPGQVVGYPIIDLENFKTDISWYLRTLEQVIINALAYYNIAAGRSVGETGVWIDNELLGKQRKICALGVRCSRWVTMHGFALNVNNDLSYFNHIIPCGITNKTVTSMQQEIKNVIDEAALKNRLAVEFVKLFS